MKALAIVPLVMAITVATPAHARWQIQYDAEADRVLHLGGKTLRNDFATRAEADAWQRSRPTWEQNHSRPVGKDDELYIEEPGTDEPTPGLDRDPAPPAVRTKAEADAKAKAIANAQAAAAGASWGGKDAKTTEDLDNIFNPSPGAGTNAGLLSEPAPVSLVQQEQNDFEKNPGRWKQLQMKLLEERVNNPYIPEIYRSLVAKAPAPLPHTKYDMLKPGDVLLVFPEKKSFWAMLRDSSTWIEYGDRVSSLSLSPASHTVLFLREVNGKKLFLDHTSERGSHVIGEAEYLKTYGNRETLVAQPVKEAETAKIWAVTKGLVKKEQEKLTNGAERRTDAFTDRIRDLSGFGLYGDNMVCAEADRWVLVNSGLKIPETASPLKRLLGIHYGPANYFSDKRNFVITPLYAVPDQSTQQVKGTP